MFFVGISLLLLGVYVLASAYSSAHVDVAEQYGMISPAHCSSKVLHLSPRAHVFNVVSNQDLTALVVGFPLTSPRHLLLRRPEWHALSDSTQGSQQEEEDTLHKETILEKV